MIRIIKITAFLPAIAFAMMTMTVSSCSSSEDIPSTPDTPLSNENNERRDIEITRSETDLVNGNNDFAFNLFRQAGVRKPSTPSYSESEKSTILSPISITFALGMLNNGAAGETQAQINKVLGFGDAGADGINQFCRKMLTEAPTLDKLTKVMIANNIYVNEGMGYKLKPDFLKLAKTYYDADAESRNFADGKTRKVINQWGSDHTEGVIKEVLKEDEFNTTAISYLLNAIYFKGAWAQKFDKANTQNEDFQTLSGNKQLPMMHQEHQFNYTQNALCQALRLPYGNGAYNLTVLLPHEGKSLWEVAASLTAESWQEYQTMGSAIVDVKLPRFESDSDIDLKPVMIALGMPNAFGNLAEFPNFANSPAYIGLMKQVAHIQLNEEGTEAAAVTVIEMRKSSAGPQYVKFHATRPFLYVISEQSTGAVFFIGKYMGD